MRFTLLGALQGDVIRKRLSSFQRQSYIPVILAVQDSKVLQTTQALTTTEYQVRCLIKKTEITFRRCTHPASQPRPK